MAGGEGKVTQHKLDIGSVMRPEVLQKATLMGTLKILRKGIIF